MSSKCEKWFISSLCWSFGIMIILLILFGGTCFIFYSDISLDSKISSFFSFISSLGILATIIIYMLQKNNANRSKKNRQREMSISYFNIFETYAIELKEIAAQLITLRDILNKTDNSIIECHDRYNIYTFLVVGVKGEVLGNIIMFKFDSLSLSAIHSNSASINIHISENYLFLYKHSLQLISFIENLIINISNNNSKKHTLDCLQVVSLDKFIDSIELCVQRFNDYCKNL